MAVQSENQIQSAIKRKLEKHGWYVNKFEMSEGGFPDLICLKQGRTVFIEVKRVGMKPRPLQDFRIKKLNEMGFLAFWSDTKEHKLITEMCNE
jgi:hypothetical protein